MRWQRNFRFACESWLVGLIVAGILLAAMATLDEIRNTSADNHDAMIRFALRIVPLRILLSLTLGALLTLPLFVVTALFTLLYQDIIAKWPGRAIALSTGTLWFLLSVVMTEARQNNWAKNHMFWEKFHHISLSFDVALFVIPFLCASLYYVRRLRRDASWIT